jgi:hypothetical protein
LVPAREKKAALSGLRIFQGRKQRVRAIYNLLTYRYLFTAPAEAHPCAVGEKANE